MRRGASPTPLYIPHGELTRHLQAALLAALFDLETHAVRLPADLGADEAAWGRWALHGAQVDKTRVLAAVLFVQRFRPSARPSRHSIKKLHRVFMSGE